LAALPPPLRPRVTEEKGGGVGASRALQIIPNRYFILLPLAIAYICIRFIYT
jgi:hypothetical protein